LLCEFLFVLITTSGFCISIRTTTQKFNLHLTTNANNKCVQQFWWENLKDREHLEAGLQNGEERNAR
jgi:hypothetical protein